MRFARSIAVASALPLVLAAGCMKLHDEVTLNPDGSGKVAVHRLRPVPPNLNMGGKGGDVDPEKAARNVARKLIEDSKGVAA